MDVALELRGAGRVGAIADGFPFGSVSRRAANRATLRHDEFPFVSVAPLGDNLHHLGDHVAGALDDDGVTNADVLAPNLVLVVERSPTNDHTADVDRLEHGQWRQSPGAANVNHDVVDAGCLLSGWKFVGRSPARFPRNKSEFLLLAQIVDFDDDAVNLEWQSAAALEPPLAASPNSVDRLIQSGIWRGLESEAAKFRECVGMRRYGTTAFCVADAIGKQTERPLRCDRRVELP